MELDTSPTPIAGDSIDPQSLNRYPYVTNDPVNSVDPSGACGEIISVDIEQVGTNYSPAQITFVVTGYTFAPGSCYLEENFDFSPASFIGAGALLVGGGSGTGHQTGKGPNKGAVCNTNCHKPSMVAVVTPESKTNLNPCAALAVVSVPLAFAGVPEVATYLEIGAGTARVLAWIGVAGSLGGVGCM